MESSGEEVKQETVVSWPGSFYEVWRLFERRRASVPKYLSLSAFWIIRLGEAMYISGI